MQCEVHPWRNNQRWQRWKMAGAWPRWWDSEASRPRRNWRHALAARTPLRWQLMEVADNGVGGSSSSSLPYPSSSFSTRCHGRGDHDLDADSQCCRVRRPYPQSYRGRVILSSTPLGGTNSSLMPQLSTLPCSSSLSTWWPRSRSWAVGPARRPDPAWSLDPAWSRAPQRVSR